MNNQKTSTKDALRAEANGMPEGPRRDLMEEAADRIEELERRCNTIRFHATWCGDGYKLSLNRSSSGQYLSKLIDILYLARRELDVEELLGDSAEGTITVKYHFESWDDAPWLEVVEVDRLGGDKSDYEADPPHDGYYYSPHLTWDRIEKELEKFRAIQRLASHLNSDESTREIMFDMLEMEVKS